MSTFKVGDKVKIIEGGWGIHSCFIGKVVTIKSSAFSRYTWEEDLVGETFTQRAGQHSAD